MKLFVWDLHGVLEHGNDRAVTDISNEALSRFGYTERFTYEDGQLLYGQRWYEYFDWLLRDESRDRTRELQEICFKLSEECPEYQYKWIEPTPHSHEVLKEIGSGHDQILISNTRETTLDTFLGLLDLHPYFEAGRYFAVDNHGAHSSLTKSDYLSQYLDVKSHYDEIVIIGDSPSDMRLSEVSGGTTYLFAHPGFNFRECTSSYKIRDLRKVLAKV